MGRVIISGGHWDNPDTKKIEDQGCSYAGYNEFQICQNIRNEVLRIIPSAIPVPSNITLRQKIDFINSFCNKDDLIIEIHLNSNTNTKIEGTEAYYSYEKYLADIFAIEVSKALGVSNRGAIHDSHTYVGSLGWLRQIKSDNCVLIEVCYLSNPSNRIKIIMPSGQMKAAQGIVNAINKHLGNLTILEQLKKIYLMLLKIINDKRMRNM